MKAKELTYTPKGLTQNWDFSQRHTKSTKKRNGGGDFVSRKIRIVRFSEDSPATVERIQIPRESTEFSIRKKENQVIVSPRKNGKFCGKQQVYSESLAKKLGLI